MSNEVARRANDRTPQAVIKDVNIQKMIAERLGARAGQFTTSLLSLVNSNDKIAECTPMTIIQAALTAAAMDLPINQNLGFAYIVPYKNKGIMEASFQMGWKGFVQLAMRSGKFKYINSTDVRQGEIVKRDRLSGAMEFKWIEDEVQREKAPIIGYVSFFELHDGFTSTFYMSMAEVTAHAKRYSQSFKSGFGPWKDNFPAMAKKTVTKLNLSANAPMSTEMADLQRAVETDQSVIREDGRADYIDGEVAETEVPQAAIDDIAKAESPEQLQEIVNELNVEQRKAAVPYVNDRMKELNPPAPKK